MSIMLSLRWRVTTFLGTLAARQQRIQMGKNVVFYGLPIVTSARLGRIRLGDNVVVVSDSRATALGVRSRAILRLLDASAEIEIGNDTGLSGTTICAARSVKIGERCLIGADVMIFDTDFHNHSPDNRRYSKPMWDSISNPIVIGDDVFIGTRCIISKGAEIGNGCVIGAGSVVTGRIPPYSIAVGSPAKVVSQLDVGGKV